MFENYSEFSSKGRQHNIMCLVGNGFDVASLIRINNEADMKNPNLGLGPTVTSKYEDFYYYLVNDVEEKKRFGTVKKDITNMVFLKMFEASRNKAKKTSNWCDFENIVDEIAFGKRQKNRFMKIKDINKVDVDKLNEDLYELQEAFSRFLNKLLPSEKIVKFDQIVRDNDHSYQSLSCFLGDLDGENDIAFPDRIVHNTSDDTEHLLNYLFVDFNYTMLLDSYINLDRRRLYRARDNNSSQNNFYFFPNIDKKCSRSGLSDYDSDRWKRVRILTQVVHPHGIQDSPGSMLFGTERKGKGCEPFVEDARWQFIKSIWARDKEKFGQDFDKAELFIIFGMSITETDGWWFSEIYKRILEGWNRYSTVGPELIIYNFKGDGIDANTLKDKFINACIYVNDFKSNHDKIKEHIYVATHDGSTNYFLGFSEFKKKEIVEMALL